MRREDPMHCVCLRLGRESPPFFSASVYGFFSNQCKCAGWSVLCRDMKSTRPVPTWRQRSYSYCLPVLPKGIPQGLSGCGTHEVRLLLRCSHRLNCSQDEPPISACWSRDEIQMRPFLMPPSALSPPPPEARF